MSQKGAGTARKSHKSGAARAPGRRPQWMLLEGIDANAAANLAARAGRLSSASADCGSVTSTLTKTAAGLDPLPACRYRRAEFGRSSEKLAREAEQLELMLAGIGE